MGVKVQMPSKADMAKAFDELRAKIGVDAIPAPKGWRMLVMMPAFPEKTSGGIILTDNYVDAEVLAAPIGYVVEMGAECFADPKKFPSGNRCEVGDVVIFRQYSGTRLVLNGKEFRVLTDEAIECTVDDPRSIERV